MHKHPACDGPTVLWKAGLLDLHDGDDDDGGDDDDCGGDDCDGDDCGGDDCGGDDCDGDDCDGDTVMFRTTSLIEVHYVPSTWPSAL